MHMGRMIKWGSSGGGGVPELKHLDLVTLEAAYMFA